MNQPQLDNPFQESRLNLGSDYRPEWDVPELNRSITERLAQHIREVKGRVQPDPGQMISVLLSPPGFGKTHLFGRIGSKLGDEVLFVFVPAFEDVSQPLEHIRWHVVETLFRQTAGNPSGLQRALARLCQPSFVQYVSQFPPSLAARYQALLPTLQEGSQAVLDLVQAVTPLEPFRRLAASIAHRLPHIAFPIVNALALGWSPLADLARCWLRGDSLPKNDLAALGLPENADPPRPLDVLKAIAPLLQYQTPLVICCDQIEMVLKAPKGPEQVSAELVEILHQVPNQILLLSCLQTEWEKFLNSSFSAFRQRVANPQRLADLTESQAVELVARRMQCWNGREPQQEKTWPFEEASIRMYVRDCSQNPRSLIQRCGELFAGWLEGNRNESLYVTRPKDVADPAKLFLQLWNAELESIARDPAVTWSDYQEERLYRGVHEMLTLARDAGREMAGVRVRNVAENALRQRGQVKRRAVALDLAEGKQTDRVVVAVTTLNNGPNFRFYFEDIEFALQGQTKGCLLVHRQAEFQMGAGTRARFEPLLGKKLRVFALDQNLATLLRLECLLRFLDRASGQELQLDNVTLSYKDCQDYLLKTAVLDNVDLLKSLSAWCMPEATAEAAIPPSAVAVAIGATVQDAATDRASTTTVVPAVGSAVALAPSPHDNLRESGAKDESWAIEKLNILVAKLKLWGLPVSPVGVEIGPAFARLKIDPTGSRTTFNKVRDKTTDLKIQLGLKSAPLIDSQPGCISVDVELPRRRTVALAEVLADAPVDLANRPVFPVGVDVAGQPHWLDLSDTSDCHLLVAGQTGSGKSEFLRALVVTLAMRLDPDQLQFVIIDPKRVTFNLGTLESPYLHAPVAYEAEAALPLFEWCMEETRNRYEMLAQQRKTNVGQLEDQTLLPRVVVVVDEFAELLVQKETKTALNGLLKQIGALARAAGIHLVLATQRPDKDVVTPLLKSNLPGRIALHVANEANSKLILGDPSAAYLLGKGDLLWQHGGGLLRLQSPFVSQTELEKALRAH
jgi:S-DNA-T family DNA segregation ATPase FtsK/SpoIIIE